MNILLEMQAEEASLYERIIQTATNPELSENLRIACIHELVEKKVYTPAFHAGYRSGVDDTLMTDKSKSHTLKKEEDDALATIKGIYQMCQDIKLTTELEERILCECRDVLYPTTKLHTS